MHLPFENKKSGAVYLYIGIILRADIVSCVYVIINGDLFKNIAVTAIVLLYYRFRYH